MLVLFFFFTFPSNVLCTDFICFWRCFMMENFFGQRTHWCFFSMLNFHTISLFCLQVLSHLLKKILVCRKWLWIYISYLTFMDFNPFHLSITVITAIVNSRNFRELSAMFIFYLSDQTTKSQAMFLLKFLRISSVLYSECMFARSCSLLSFLCSL